MTKFLVFLALLVGSIQAQAIDKSDLVGKYVVHAIGGASHVTIQKFNTMRMSKQAVGPLPLLADCRGYYDLNLQSGTWDARGWCYGGIFGIRFGGVWYEESANFDQVSLQSLNQGTMIDLKIKIYPLSGFGKGSDWVLFSYDKPTPIVRVETFKDPDILAEAEEKIKLLKEANNGNVNNYAPGMYVDFGP